MTFILVGKNEDKLFTCFVFVFWFSIGLLKTLEIKNLQQDMLGSPMNVANMKNNFSFFSNCFLNP